MSSLAGEDLVRLATAIGNAFVAEELEELVRMTFSESLYQSYTARDLTDKVLILRLLEALERRGTIVIFLRAVRRARPHRQDLIDLIGKLCPQAMNDPSSVEERLEDERRRREAVFLGSSVPQEEASAKLTWPQILFSFKGRLSRMQFLIGLISTLAFAAVLSFAIALTIEPFFQAAQPQTEEATTKLPELLERRLLLVVTISSWWPALALVLKRLHDLGQGWKALLVFVALDVLWAVLHLLNNDELAQPIAGIDLGLTFMLALIKGTTGPNRYGPEPLGGAPDLTKR